MLKKRIRILFVLCLAVVLIIVSWKYKNLLSEYNLQQTAINRNFIDSLSSAASPFGSNLINNERYNGYYYNDVMTKLEAASQLFHFTTYNNGNNQLQFVLYKLCTYMKESIYMEAIIQKSNLIYENLSKLAQNPEDEQSIINLTNLIEEIHQRK